MSQALFNEFVSVVCDGNQAKAAEALGIGRSMVSRICAGRRRVSPEVALRIEQVSGGRYLKERFVWPDAPKRPAPPRKPIPEHRKAG